MLYNLNSLFKLVTNLILHGLFAVLACSVVCSSVWSLCKAGRVVKLCLMVEVQDSGPGNSIIIFYLNLPVVVNVSLNNANVKFFKLGLV